jgi:hypothetical protein
MLPGRLAKSSRATSAKNKAVEAPSRIRVAANRSRSCGDTFVGAAHHTKERGFEGALSRDWRITKVLPFIPNLVIDDSKY